MNFTQEIKRELIKHSNPKRCCQLATLAAVLDTSGTLGEEGFSFTIESEETAAYLLRLSERALGVNLAVTGAVRDPKHGRDKLTFSYFGGRSDALLGVRCGELLEECCRESYLRGAFLGGGSCTLPHGGTKTGYHLEIIFEKERMAEDFCTLLDAFQVIGNIIVRNDRYVVYLKSRESISDFLSVIGAEGALKTLETVSKAREERNNVNRKSNCYASNADKAATASAQQALAFGRMKEEGKLSVLPDPLREVAKARLESPALSLSELAEKLGIGKSCLNHRLRKLMEIYKKETLK